MPTLSITVETFDHHGRATKITHLTGSADSSNVAAIDAEMTHLLGESIGPLDLIINGSSLDYVNSTFVGHVAGWYAALTARGGRLVLAALTPQVRDTLDVVGLLALIPHAGSVDEAKLLLAGEHV